MSSRSNENRRVVGTASTTRSEGRASFTSNKRPEARTLPVSSLSPEVAEICEQLDRVSAPPRISNRPRARTATPSRVRMAVLSAVAGYVDAAGFTALAGLFPAHVTGELVAALAGVWMGSWSRELVRFFGIVMFLVAVVGGALVSRRYRRQGRSPLGVLLAMMAVALLFSGVSGALAPAFAPGDKSLQWALEMTGVVGAMGLQNVIMRHVLSSSCPTTVMTGNLTQFIVELIELIADVGKHHVHDENVSVVRPTSARLRVIGTALAAFLGSALLGGLFTTAFGAISIVIPALAIGALCFQELRHPTAPTRTGTLF